MEKYDDTEIIDDLYLGERAPQEDPQPVERTESISNRLKIIGVASGGLALAALGVGFERWNAHRHLRTA